MRALWALVAMATVVGGCSDAHPPPEPRAVPLAAPPTVAALDDGCDAAPSGTVDRLGSVHTVPPRPARAVYAVAIAPKVVCPGGTIRVAVRVTNPTSGAITVTPALIITRPSNPLGCCDAMTVAAHGSRTVTTAIVIPASTPVGTHEIRFRDYLPGRPRADQTAIVVVKASG